MVPKPFYALPFKAQCVAKPTEASPYARLSCCNLFLAVLECYMTDVIRRNECRERTALSGRLHRDVAEPTKSAFHALTAPSITPVEYLRRLARFSFSSRPVFVAAFIYLHRVAAISHAPLLVDSLSVHRLLLTAVLLATKFFDDLHYDNAHFAKIGGLHVAELNMLELQLLDLLHFNLSISVHQFDVFESSILDSALATSHPDYIMLPNRLRNLGYGPELHPDGSEPHSPISTMATPFDAHCNTTHNWPAHLSFLVDEPCVRHAFVAS